MTLSRITISGADDEVDPWDLVDLTRRFPFVEWGILVSKRPGRPRYPTSNWLNSLADALMKGRMFPHFLSAHLCGSAAEEFCQGESSWVQSLPANTSRLQINGCQPWPAPVDVIQNALGSRNDLELIVQVREVTDLNTALLFAESVTTPGNRVSALFDPSGGRGLETKEWPSTPATFPLGYAGGIKPSTIESTISQIGKRSKPYWLDMESGVRTDDRFDLKLVREVLVRAAPYIGATT